MKISFIVLNRNNKEFLNKCLFSIKKTGLKNKEVILVDDASEDNSLKSLEYRPTKILVNKKRLGIAKSRNIGFNSATGNYVFYIDSDIEITKINIKKIHKLFESNPTLVAISGNYSSPTNKDWNSVLDFRRKYIFDKNKTEYVYSLNRKYTTFSGGFCVINKDRVKNIGKNGKIATTGEDILFQVRLLNNGYCFAYTPAIQGIHYHKRPLWEAIKKAQTEAKGDVWLMQTLIQNNLKIPALEGIFNGPLLLILGILFGPLFLLIEFSPYLLLIIAKPGSDSVKLLLYTLYLEILTIYYSMQLLFSSTFSTKNKITFLRSILINSIVAKYRWVLNKL